jgi:hypothetical protein
VSVARATGCAERDEALRMVRRQRVNGIQGLPSRSAASRAPTARAGVPPTRDVIVQERPHGVRPDPARIETPPSVSRTSSARRRALRHAHGIGEVGLFARTERRLGPRGPRRHRAVRGEQRLTRSYRPMISSRRYSVAVTGSLRIPRSSRIRSDTPASFFSRSRRRPASAASANSSRSTWTSRGRGRGGLGG